MSTLDEYAIEELQRWDMVDVEAWLGDVHLEILTTVFNANGIIGL